MPRIKRRFAGYSDWEDFRAGMYELPSCADDQAIVPKCAWLLRTSPAFFNCGVAMLSAWPVAASVALSNPHLNQQAWIGHATCSYVFEAKEHQAIEAWHMLNEAQQIEANRTADEVIEVWRACYAEA